MTRRIAIPAAILTLALVGLAYAQRRPSELPAERGALQKPSDFEAQPGQVRAGPYSLAAAGGKAYVLEVSSGRLWETETAGGETVLLPIKRLTEEEAAKWKDQHPVGGPRGGGFPRGGPAPLGAGGPGGDAPRPPADNQNELPQPK
jgi:hypothetical protein